MTTPSVFVNVFNNHGRIEAHDGVHTRRAEAVEAAEQYADDYAYTLTDTGKIDLTDEFSEGYQEKRDLDAAVDAHIDEIKERRTA